MKKKIIFLVTVLVVMFAFTATAFAANIEDSNIAKAKTENSIYATNNTVYDFRQISFKSFSPSKINNNGLTLNATATGRMWYVYSEAGNTLCKTWSKSTSNGLGSTGWQIDRIYAKGKTYVNSGLKKSLTDDEDDASYAGVSFNPKAGMLDDVEQYGNHIFEETGYTSWNTESYNAY